MNMKTSRILAIVSLLALLPAWLLGCGDPEPDPVAEACAMACEGFSACEGEIMTDFPFYFDVDTCIDEFCDGGSTLVDPPGRGDEICDDSLWAYLDCIDTMTCEEWEEAGIVSVFAGRGGDACGDEADDFVLECIAFTPFPLP